MATPDKPLNQMTAQERLELGVECLDAGRLNDAVHILATVSAGENPGAYSWAQYFLGDVYEDAGNLREAMTAYNNVHRRDNPVAYASAQNSIGILYKNMGRLDDAVAAFSRVVREDNPESYAWAQNNLGTVYQTMRRLDDAAAAFRNVQLNDSPEAYTNAQFNLGNTYKLMGKTDDALQSWGGVLREVDTETYAQAQFNIGSTCKNQGRIDEAIAAWGRVRHDDNPSVYARAQLSLGLTYAPLGQLDEAIAAWSKITRDDDPETYAWAQLNLGAAYNASNKPDQAITVLSKITRDDDPKTYADAQLNLGTAYKNQDKLDKAITAWSKITRDDNPETYAQAQLGLGFAYNKSGKLDKAITAWSNIHREDGPEAYTGAQLGLGATYYTQDKLDQAIDAWSNIHREDGPEAYTGAQLGLGATYYTQDKLDQAIDAWSNIHREDDSEAYTRAQLALGGIYEDKGKIEQAKEAYRNARDFLYYKGERRYRILECPQEVIEKLHDIAKNTDEVLKSLQIIPEYESKVAHYSRPSTAFSLFGDEKNNKNPSNFRLSTIRGVNDPTEGLVLNDYWDQQGISETIHTNDTATFISCFTFNHNSLNQFRLYGKENGREATGVSLVFNKEFFSDQSDDLKFIADPSTGPSSKSEQSKSNETRKMEGGNKKKLIGKSTLYHCIYLDPETGYWTLAQRDKSTFYREHNEDADAKEKWEKYYKLISKKEECVEKYLFSEKDNNNKPISSILKSIFAEDHLYNKFNKDEKQKILEAIRFILLPLQYLVKHIAFQEEQECRIMYITQFRDEKIHSDREKQWMYVEYEEPVLPHIDKIWLSPGAAKDQDFFRILLDKGENDNKVRISQNPFRNKE